MAGVATELVGWTSAFVLVATIASQVVKQWRSGTSDGVSTWLFRGQIAASLGFTIYSVTVDDWVFVVTNALVLALAITGYAILVHHRRRHRAR